MEYSISVVVRTVLRGEARSFHTSRFFAFATWQSARARVPYAGCRLWPVAIKSMGMARRSDVGARGLRIYALMSTTLIASTSV
jgi:hypothetical protein